MVGFWILLRPCFLRSTFLPEATTVRLTAVRPLQKGRNRGYVASQYNSTSRVTIGYQNEETIDRRPKIHPVIDSVNTKRSE